MSNNNQIFDFKIRAAKPGDEGAILGLIRQLAEYERLLDQVVATEEDIKQHLFGDKPAAEVLLADSEGTIVGFALFFTNYSTFLGRTGVYLEDLFVLPESRGQGIGLALLKALAKVVVNRNGGRLEWSVLNWNQSAIDFYERVGAVPMKEWTVYRLTGEALRKFVEK